MWSTLQWRLWKASKMFGALLKWLKHILITVICLVSMFHIYGLFIVIKVFLFSQLFITFLFSLIIVCAFSHLLLSLLHPFLFALPSVFLYSYLLSCIFIFYVLLSLCFYKLCSDFIMSNGLNPSVPIEVLSYVRSCAAFCLRFFCLKLTISRDIHFFFLVYFCLWDREEREANLDEY